MTYLRILLLFMIINDKPVNLMLAGLFFFILSIMVTKGCESNEVATFSPNRPFALIFAYHFPKTKGVY